MNGLRRIRGGCFFCGSYFFRILFLLSLSFLFSESISSTSPLTDDIFSSNFGKAGTPYDFAAMDINRLKAKAAELEEAQKGMKKKINPKVINMLDRYVRHRFIIVPFFLIEILFIFSKKKRGEERGSVDEDVGYCVER
jgi:hypothetical protein